jgi:hypothetical protein
VVVVTDAGLVGRHERTRRRMMEGEEEELGMKKMVSRQCYRRA